MAIFMGYVCATTHAMPPLPWKVGAPLTGMDKTSLDGIERGEWGRLLPGLHSQNIWDFNADNQLGLARCFERFANYLLWCLTQYDSWLVMLDPLVSSHVSKISLR